LHCPTAPHTSRSDDSEAEPLLLYDVGTKLGAGAFGEVKLAVHKATGERVAIKTYVSLLLATITMFL
jgi:serine/threonine protein kinase